MSTLLDHYFSFHGRLARLPFFIRGIYLVIAAVVLFFVSVALFSNGGRIWWWLGLIEVIVCLSVLGVGSVSLIVRRLHDLGFSGYHVIWVGAAELGSTVLSYGPPVLMLLALPLAAVDLWLTFWPGMASANRFGAMPD